LNIHTTRNIQSEEIETEPFIQNVINEVTMKHQMVIKEYTPSKVIRKQTIGTIICFPVILRKKLYCIFYFDTVKIYKFTKFEKNALLSLFYFITLNLEKINLRESGIKDHLTSLYNRDYLFTRIKEEHLKAKRFKESSCLISINITNFKRINEIFGYENGNLILMNFSQFLKGLFREYDLLFHYGGDKFIVLLPGTSLKDAEKTAIRIRKKIENQKFLLSGKEISLNTTIGIMEITAHFDPTKTAEELDKLFLLSKTSEHHKSLGELKGQVPQELAHKIEMFVGTSETANSLRQLIQTFSSLHTSVLLIGETGTGKDLVAKLLHELSNRKDKPFLTIECAAVPETLLESELFGYEKGAFTGAYKCKHGLIEIAQNGTLYLDNINNLPLSLQAKILRAIEEKSFLRLGGEKELKVDVRIIASTTKDLKEEVKAGRFRDDLFQRLNILTIYLPPLRNRKEDIIPIAEYFLKILCPAYKKFIKGLSEEAKKALLSYEWPGNVRELKYRIERAIIHNNTGIIEPQDLGIEFKKTPLSIKEHLLQLQLELINEALVLHNGNISKAAKELGISRTTFYKVLKHTKSQSLKQ
ncbi:MAG: sigma 54-interacting transcriptional regulator, partial [candidate division WOR-3 bacterium]